MSEIGHKAPGEASGFTGKAHETPENTRFQRVCPRESVKRGSIHAATATHSTPNGR